MDKLKMRSENLVERNIDKIAELFPNCITEVIKGYRLDGKNDDAPISGGEPIIQKVVDFDLLRQELSSVLVEGKDERYRLDWNGKRQAILTANSPIAKTLRPVREDETTPTGLDSKGNPYASSGSVGKDGTKGGFDSENLYIEGDNLDVLKLLHQTYLNKIKMIYIDPPYNTGNDFVYNDDFAEDAEEYLLSSNQKDDQGNKLTTNKDTSGRYHSDWLSMMYMRLKLAKDLLTDDGVIFISIDDNEQANLKKICEEVFGASNYIVTLKVLSNPRGRQSSNFFAEAGEYVLCYAKNVQDVNVIGEDANDEQKATYNKKDKIGKYREMGLRKRGSDSRREDSPTMFFPIYYNPTEESIALRTFDKYVEILPKLEDGSDGRWRWSKNKILTDIDQLYCRQVKRNGELVYDVFQKDYLKADSKIKHKDFWVEKEINYDRSSQELRGLFTDKLFDYAKPLYLIKKIVNTIIKRNDIVLDFFSGSATTAHAVMQLNAEDGGNRKFICVQLPEVTDEKSEAHKAGYSNICEIGKERIRRAGKKILDEQGATEQRTAKHCEQTSMFDNVDGDSATSIEQNALDIGFRVLKLDDSNMKDVYYNPSDYLAKEKNFLYGLEKSIKEDRTAEDVLFQIMLDKGVLLSSQIDLRKAVSGNQSYYVVGKTDYDIIDLICCLDDDIDTEAVKEIVKLKPECCVFLDSSMHDDSTRTNIQQIFTTYSPNTKVEVI